MTPYCVLTFYYFEEKSFKIIFWPTNKNGKRAVKDRLNRNSEHITRQRIATCIGRVNILL